MCVYCLRLHAACLRLPPPLHLAPQPHPVCLCLLFAPPLSSISLPIPRAPLMESALSRESRFPCVYCLRRLRLQVHTLYRALHQRYSHQFHSSEGLAWSFFPSDPLPHTAPPAAPHLHPPENTPPLHLAPLPEGSPYGEPSAVGGGRSHTDSRSLALSTWVVGGAAAGRSTSAQRGACTRVGLGACWRPGRCVCITVRPGRGRARLRDIASALPARRYVVFVV